MAKSFEIDCAGYAIASDWYEGERTDQIILILPGFTSSRTRQAKFTDSITEATGASALVIDYSGHGDSPFNLKDTRPAQHLLEVINAFDWITTNFPSAKISVIGNSYGSFLSAHLTHFRDIDKLVLRAPAIYRPNTFYDLWSKRFSNNDIYRESISSYRTNSEELNHHPLFQGVKTKIHGSTLVVVHEHDEVIPVQTSNAYIEAFGADMFVAKGFKHAVSKSDVSQEHHADYHQHISNWLKSF